MAKRLTPLANTEYRHVTTANSANESTIRLSSALFAPAQFLHLRKCKGVVTSTAVRQIFRGEIY